jgi:LmbE family N-acetylglucosaminyl deacetylase
VLIVIAHPDDDAGFAGSVYKITHDLKGTVDLALVTNGEGGFKYSTLAEDIYGLELTEEEIGRKNLPDIRKKELVEGGKIVGYSNYFFLNQKDHKYTNNIPEVLDSIWDTEAVIDSLTRIINNGRYDYIFTLTPTPTTHAHHSSAGILTLRAVDAMDIKTRPIVLAGYMTAKTDSIPNVYSGHPDYPITNINKDAPVFVFDRTAKFGFNDALDYKIIANWLIAEHKSQGTMQLLMNRGDYENYAYYAINDSSRIEKTKALFELLKINHFPKKTYENN